MGDMISFFAAGEPQPKGSTKSFYIKKLARVVTTSSNKDLKTWELRVAHEAQTKAAEVGWTFGPDESYEVSAAFYFSEPKSYSKKWWWAHTKRPDLDKLGRAILDGLTDVLFIDDSMVTDLTLSKGYSGGSVSPGADVKVIRNPGRWPR